MKEIGSYLNPFDKSKEDIDRIENSALDIQSLSNSELLSRALFLRTQILKNAYAADLGSLNREGFTSNLQETYIVEYILLTRQIEWRNLN